MRRWLLAWMILPLAACNREGSEISIYTLSQDPVSVRGWIADVKGAKKEESVDMEIARRTALFQSTSLWVEKSQYSSGAIAENGSFVILDVPPQTATIGFNAPGAQTARIVLQNIPGSADVFIPDIVLEPGGATVLDPKKILVRLPGKVDKPRPTGKNAIVAGIQVPIVETPLSQMTDRRDFPNPGGFRPVAVFK